MERTCKFIPHRNDRIQCRREILPSNDDKPFCKRHANTLQAQSYSHYEKNDERKTKSPRDEGNTYKKVQIVQNDFGNFEDKDTGIVFDKTTRKAKGYQNNITGEVHPLSSSHIATCKKNYWDYIVPDKTQETTKDRGKNEFLEQKKIERELQETERRMEESEQELTTKEKLFQLKVRERRLKERERNLKQKQDTWKEAQINQDDSDDSDDSDDVDDDDDDDDDARDYRAHSHAHSHAHLNGYAPDHSYGHVHDHAHGHARPHPTRYFR